MKFASRSALVISFGILLFAAPASASAPDACLTAPVDGQKLRRAGKLLESRKSFTFCAREACPREVVQACTRWEHEVEGAIPSVVLAARDDAGHDVAARIAIDGGEPNDPGARAIELDPGEHRFVFTKAGSPPIEQRVVIREGEKNRVVTAIFPSPRVEPVAPVVVPPAAPPEPSWWTPLRTTGAITGAVGAATLLTGFGLAAIAKVDYDSARDECAAPDDCPRDAVEASDRARSLGDVATVVVLAGAGVTLVGAALLLFSPSRNGASSKSTGRLDLDVGPLSFRVTQTW